MNLKEKKHKKKPVIFSYAMVNLGILKITFNCFLTYKAIQTRPLVLLVDSPYKSCIATHHEHVDVNVLDTSDTFFNVNDVIKDE
jgi:hypothetical protein